MHGYESLYLNCKFLGPWVTGVLSLLVGPIYGNIVTIIQILNINFSFTFTVIGNKLNVHNVFFLDIVKFTAHGAGVGAFYIGEG